MPVEERTYTPAELQAAIAAERAATIEQIHSILKRTKPEGFTLVSALGEIMCLPHDRSALDAEIGRATKPLREKIARLQAVIDSLGRVATEAINTAVANALNERAEQKA
jgi:hypothetical protein